MQIWEKGKATYSTVCTIDRVNVLYSRSSGPERDNVPKHPQLKSRLGSSLASVSGLKLPHPSKFSFPPFQSSSSSSPQRSCASPPSPSWRFQCSPRRKDPLWSKPKLKLNSGSTKSPRGSRPSRRTFPARTNRIALTLDPRRLPKPAAGPSTS